MPQPYDYTLGNLPSPTENLINSLALAKGFQQLKTQKTDAEKSAQAQAQLQADLSQLGTNPTPAGLAQLMVKYPSMSEQFKRTYDVLSAEQQRSRVNQASQVYAALEAGHPDMAQRILKEQAVAYRNSGMEREAKTLDDLAEMVRLSPETARTSTGLFLASAMGPEKFTETFTQLQAERREADLAPERLTEAQAKARQAAVKADFAESEAVMDLQKKGWDIYKIQEDVKIARENSRIAALKAQIDREQNDLKRQELQTKLAEAQRKQDQKVREQVATVESGRTNIDNMLNNIDGILQTPSGTLDDALGAWDGSWVGGLIDTFDQDVQDFVARLENLDAQAFLAQVPQMKGLGALSENEGKKLSGALQSFSRKQSKEQFIANAKEAQRIMLKARKTLAQKYGVPETIPDTPAVESTPEDIEALLQKYGGGQ
jgi:hypothetical protein